jgi:acetoacetyl-CoA synthetase
MSLRSVAAGELLRPAPPRSAWHESRMGRFLELVEREHRVRFETYEDAWQWSVDNLDSFWRDVWREFDVISHAPWQHALDQSAGADAMPGARWFEGARINYAEHVMRGAAEHAAAAGAGAGAGTSAPLVLGRSQTRPNRDLTAAEFSTEVARIQAGLRRAGVTGGDRVVGYLPNIPETVATYVAVAGLGAIWCSVPPEMGTQSVLDRIEQLDPALIIAVDGYRWGAKTIDRTSELAAIRAALPRLTAVVLPYLDDDAVIPDGAISWRAFTAPGDAGAGAAIGGRADAIATFLPVAFEHPLVILFSSGTTGKPKAIVHSHGGLLTEHLKAIGLHFAISTADTTFWYTTTGWMVWTLSVSSLLLGASMVLVDGDPNWPSLDGEWSQWAVLEETRATYFVTGAAYLAACAHAGLRPGTTWNLSRVREIQCSGSPLAPDVAGWVYDSVASDVLLHPASGGTDICSGFLMGGPLTGVWAGEMSCRPLGVAVESWNPAGETVVGEPGELVCTKPMPSMPVFFWGDVDHERYLAAYFDVYPGVWRHGDWLIHTEHGTWMITGRSDATLNRGGVRLGTAEFYAVLDPLAGLADSVILHFEDAAGGMGKLVLVAVASATASATATATVTLPSPSPQAEDDATATAALEKSIRTVIRTSLSPRHVPDLIVWAPSVPRSLTGKRLEIPLKRLVQGATGAQVVDAAVLARPDDLPIIVELTRRALGEVD